LKIIDNLENIDHSKPKILTLGSFDGVHYGHISVLNYINNLANKLHGESYILTLEPHPRLVLQPNSDFKLLTLLDEKIKLLENHQLQNLIIQAFNKKFSEMSAFEFVKEILVEKLQIHTLVIGFNHHFGKNREGNFSELQKLQQEFGFDLIQLPEIKNDESKISSTQIRKDINEGNIFSANLKLGYDFFIKGKVIKGQQIGSKIGFPTANLEIDSTKIIPKNGSYIVEINLDEKTYSGMLNIGNRPTVDGKNIQIEVHIHDFDQDIYGKQITVFFKDFLREEIKFENLNKLQHQLELDRIKSKKFF